MSADAKAWQNDDGWWFGIHDGECLRDDTHTTNGYLSLTELLEAVDQCGGYRYAWSIRAYPNDKYGLVGYVYGGIRL